MHIRWTWKKILAVVLVVGLAAGVGYSWHRGWLERSWWRATWSCGPQDWTPGPPEPIADGDGGLDLEPFEGTVTLATSIAYHPDGQVGYVTEQGGAVRLVRDDVIAEDAAVQIDVSVEHDQGLLAGVVDPDGRHLYLLSTGPDGDSSLDAFDLDDDGEPDPGSRRQLLAVGQPDVYHNGGGLAFLPDTTLLVAIGDGGKIGDRDDNAQRPSTRLGGVLRIDPTPDADEPYRVPDDNPRVDNDGADPETWALGVRNPFRLSVDAAGGRVWVGDVGHNCFEEIDVVPMHPDRAPNFGWNRFEGTRVFLGDPPDDYVEPRVAMPHADDQACAVIGGIAYRSDKIPELTGRYVFSDLCLSRLLAIDADADADADGAVTDLGLTLPGVIGVFADPTGAVIVVSPNQVARVVPG